MNEIGRRFFAELPSENGDGLRIQGRRVFFASAAKAKRVRDNERAMRILRLTALWMALQILGLSSILAQPQDEPPNVYLDVSTDARNKLRTLDAYVRQEEWSEAVGLLQSLIEANPNKLVPNGTDAASTFLNLRTYCQYRLSRLPAEAIRVYRQRVDGQAKDLLDRYTTSGDRAHLTRIVDELFCSSTAPTAIELLADRAVSDGEYSRARSLWRQILPRDLVGDDRPANDIILVYPNPDVDTPRVIAKYIVTEILDGNAEDAKPALAYLKEHFPHASGKLAGADAKYWEIVAAIAVDPKLTKIAAEDANWTTFAGNGQRSKIAPKPIDVGDVQWKWTFDEEPDPETDSRNPRAPANDFLAYHPIVVGSLALLATDRYLYTFHLDTGEMQQWYDFKGDAPAGGGNQDPRARYTLTAVGDRLFVRTGSNGLANNRLGRIRPAFGATSILYCFDYKKQRLLWSKPSSSIGNNGDLFFEGAPLVAKDTVYVAATRIDAMSQTSVLALNASTGELLWRTLVCEATSEQGDVGLTHNLLTLADGTIYYCTNLGAVAAMSAETGQIRWVSVYPRGKPMLSRHVTSLTPDVNPCVFHQGKLFVAPKDTSKILCFDAQTGQKLWEANPPVAHLLGVAKGTLIVTGNRVWGIDVDSGKMRWYWPENTVASHGRGILAGDYVYWPTRERIHVLEQATGRVARPAIELYDRHRLKGGNMVLGDGYLLLAQSKSLLAMVPYSRLIRKLQQELVANPDSGELHMRLAEAATAIEDFSLAKSHMKLAGEHARPGEVYDGRGLADLARERLYQSVLREAEQRAKAKDLGATVALLKEAEQAAPNPDQRLEAIAKQANIWLEHGRTTEAVRVYQGILDEPSLRERFVAADAVLKGTNTTQILAGAWARQRLDDLIRQQGRDVYAEYDLIAENALSKKITPEELLAVADRYPNTTSLAAILVAAGKAFESRGHLRDARLCYKRADRIEGIAPGIHLVALLGLERIYAKQQLDVPRENLLERLDKEFAHQPLPDDPSRTVADFVKVEQTRSQAPMPKVESTVGIYRRTWRLPSVAEGYRIPEGTSPVEDAEPIIFRCAASRIAALSLLDGRELWSVESQSEVQWLGYFPSGVVAAFQDRLVCLGLQSGNVVWEAAFDDETSQADWTANAGSAAAADAAIQVSGTSEAQTPRFAIAGDVIAVVNRSGDLVGIDGDQGVIIWKVLHTATVFLPQLRSVSSVLCAWSPTTLFGIDPSSGRRLFEAPVQGVAENGEVVRVGTRLIFVADRSTLAAIAAADFDAKEANAPILWKQSFVWPSFAMPRLVTERSDLLAIIDGYQLASLSPETGEVLWHRPLGVRPYLVSTGASTLAGAEAGIPATLKDGHFVYVNGDWLESRLSQTGEVQWRKPLPSRGNPKQVVTAGSLTLLLTETDRDANLTVWETSTGKLSQRLGLPKVGRNATLELGDGFVLVKGIDATWVLAAEPTRHAWKTGEME